MLYNRLVEFVNHQQEREADEIKSLYPYLTSIYNPFEFDKMKVTGYVQKRPVSDPPLRSYDKNLQTDLAFYIHLVNQSSDRVIWGLEILNKKAIIIISFLQKEYRLEQNKPAV